MKTLHISAFLLLAGAGFAQENEYTVQAKFGDTVPIDRVLERVDANKDQWIGERDFEALNAKLRKIAEQLKNGEAGFEPLTAEVARFSRLTLIEFKIVASSRSAVEAPTARTRVRIELGGETTGKQLLSMLGHMELSWELSGDDWKLAKADVEPLREIAAVRPYFTDITEQVLGHNASYSDQLVHGIDYWRGVLDEAVGVKVYGHHGISLGDYNGDGFEDLYVSQPSGLPNRLYRNNGNLTFSDVTAQAGLDILDDTSMSLFADLDNDGDQDLIVIAPNRPLLFRNDGQGRFALDPHAGLSLLPERGAMLTSAALADYDNDGDLDLYVCSYDFWQAGTTYDTPTPYYDATNGPPNFLFRNRGDGTFEETTAGLMENNNRYSFAAAWGDYDNDGDQDLYVANDFGRNNLYQNQGDGTFRDVAAEAGVEDMAAGMSAAWADYDSDGDLDLYVGNMWSSAGQRVTHNLQFEQVAASDETRRAFQRHARGNSLFRNKGDGTFDDITLQAGLEMGRWAWASDFFDLNNDGREDIYIQNGYITGPDLHDL